MAVTLFFRDGRISEFGSATTADIRDDGLVHVMGPAAGPTAPECVAAVDARQLSVIQVYHYGLLKKLLVISRRPSGAIDFYQT